jgi:hypothetical protein
MNRFKPTLLSSLLFGMLITSTYSCSKENNQTASNTTTTPRTMAPTVNTGGDVTIELPTNEVSLTGNYYSSSNESFKAVRKKIAGPEKYSLGNPDRLNTRVTGLEEGIYYFELTVINNDGQSDRHAVRVTVVKKPQLRDPNVIMGTNEVTFKNIEWIFPWYNALEAKDIYNYVPRDKPLNVFVRRGGTINWMPVERFDPYLPYTNHLYDYFIETRPDGAGMYTLGSLYVFYYGTDTNDTCEIRIEF